MYNKPFFSYIFNLSPSFLNSIDIFDNFFPIISTIFIYIYTSLAYSTIAKKLNYKDYWIAWIPFIGKNILKLNLGGFHWGLIFLPILPIVSTSIIFFINIFLRLESLNVLLIILFLLSLMFLFAFYIIIIVAEWRIFEKRNYSGALALLKFFNLIYLITIAFVAWQDKIDFYKLYKEKILKKEKEEKKNILNKNNKIFEVPKPTNNTANDIDLTL